MKTFSCVRTSVLVLCTGLLLASCQPKPLSFDQLRLRYRETLLSANVDPTDSLLNARTRAADESVQKAWATMNRDSGRAYLWEDSYKRFAEAQSLSMDYGRLQGMAQAYCTPGSTYYQDKALLADAIAGLDWMFANRYNPRTPLYHNWWEWVIGVPMSLNNTLVLLYDELTPSQRTDYLSAMDYYAPNVTFEGASTGANKIWQCGNMALRGIIAQRPEQVQMAVEGLSTEFVYVTSKDGFYRDGSFVQHQWHPYNGGYGCSMLAHLSNMIPLVQGSPWEVPKEYQEMLFDWIHQGYEPLLYRGAMMDMVRGREVSRKGNGDRSSGHSVLVSLLKLSKAAPAGERAHLRSVVKAHMLADTARSLLLDMPTFLLGEARSLLSDPEVAPEELHTLNKIYSSMDRAVHVRPGFALGLAMSSSRIENYETINGENLKAWYSGDGMMYLYDNDLNQYTQDFWPTVDAYRMPGTTVDTRPRKAETLPFAEGLLYADGYKSPESWVGGASLDGLYGMAGMHLKAFESPLEARKSWFMAGDEIVCLGAGITSSDSRGVETIVENRKLNAPCRYNIDIEGLPVLSEKGNLGPVSPAWVHFEGTDEGTSMGYYFPERGPLNLLRETRTGSWYEISQPYGDKTPIQKDYFTMWFDHGRNPSGATYAYVLLPGANLGRTKDYASEPGVNILSNTPALQAVHHAAEGLTGANFWAPGALENLSVDAPASVLLRETEKELTVGLSDPTQLHAGTITLETGRTVSAVLSENPKVEVLSLAPLRLRFSVSETLGQTLSVKFTK